MSIEQLLLLALLIIFPLLGRLLPMRRSSESPVNSAGLPVAEETASPLAGPVREDAAPPPPVRPQRAVPAPKFGDRAGARRESASDPRPSARVGRQAGPARFGPVNRRIRTVSALRRAIVLRTILGPCRAAQPDDVHGVW